MKLAILTQPLHNNYGGLLQAFALQKVLKKEFGFETETLDIGYDHSKQAQLKTKVKTVVKKYLLGRKVVSHFKPSDEQKLIIGRHMDAFKNKYIKTSSIKYSKANLNELKKLKFDACIVGSDQVWRPLYSPNITTYFLDFLKDNSVVKKISYAASFGVDYNEFDSTVLKECSLLLKKFDAVSVREEGAVSLCQDKFGVKAHLVLDPTLLLDVEDYRNLFDKTLEAKKQIMFYVLDPEFANREIEKKISEYFKLPVFKIMPVSPTEKNITDIQQCVYPPVEDWIEGFLTSEFIITDSFHGTIFSILFNKQFVTIGNESRGMARFTSVLKMFNLEDRLVTNLDSLENLVKNKIDFAAVNKILENEKVKSLTFLKESLQ
ncbi:polysaccharide pyruvyl transferase family protein [Flavobacterium sp. 14A]|uniref:polysaccharide pyruvyl transferase family protein n=1 Tax=Flavobacterium sp. 14A TaxID=2735896 RepID=UPI00156F5D2B|nr:polysaccharide pyruvyl transferase family protein [Flavobacterium sp. 14A]NRT13276.1 polysaccharide pyruvyl transferase WcaK-like protein [Flavobacterium sp. 14A]